MPTEERVEVFPRLRFEQLSPALQEALGPAVKRVGYFGEFFALIGHNSAALTAFMQFTSAVKAPLSDRQNEVLALVVCTRTGATYERIQHEWLCQRMGFPREWIMELTERIPLGRDTLSSDEAALRALALAMLTGPGRLQGEFHAVRQQLGDPAALAAVLQIGRFQMIAFLLQAFDMRLPVESPLES